MLCVMDRMPAFTHLKSEISDLNSRCESISRRIRAWTDSLQNSEIKGQRHLNDKTRQQYEQSQRKSDFWQRMDQFKQDQAARRKKPQSAREKRRHRITRARRSRSSLLRLQSRNLKSSVPKSTTGRQGCSQTWPRRSKNQHHNANRIDSVPSTVSVARDSGCKKPGSAVTSNTSCIR